MHVCRWVCMCVDEIDNIERRYIHMYVIDLNRG